ncbi:MAG: 5'/3'-nucleotidase SurE [Erysipelotrichaceae bacterium]|nr:5'/3'-nucleotidase SurE [Erysipelotrichaceae bacterium]
MLNILVTNDDGIKANGIAILANALKKYGSVTVVAPDGGRSAGSHSINIRKPISFERVDVIEGVDCYMTDGTPVDCVRLARSIFNDKFDLVVSGVNDGLNLGTDIIYSSTVAAAREGFIEGIPSISISTDVDSFYIVNNELESLLDYIFDCHLFSDEYYLNINFPVKGIDKSTGIKIARQGIKRFKTTFVKNTEGLYMEAKNDITYDEDITTDVCLASMGYITIVPLVVNQTDNEKIDLLENILLG